MPITATRTTTFRPGPTGDQDGDGFVDIGDILRHTLVINNTATDATNVVVNDPLNGSTLTGNVNVSPLAFNDSFTAVGNTLLEVGNATMQTGPQSSVAGNILTNDVEFLGDTFTISAFDATSANGGTVNVITTGVDAGSFTYISNDGFTGTDTFTYTIRDDGLDGIAGNADDLVSIGTVTITVSGQVWYVQAGAVGGDGTSTNPFGTVTAAGTASDANDYVYVQGNASGSIALDSGEQLIGTGTALIVGGFTLATAGANSSVNLGGAGFTVTLGSNNTISGVDILNTGGGALTGTGFGTLNVSDVALDASGQALNLNTGAISGAGFNSTDSDGGTNNVNLQSVTGSLNLGGGALSGATGVAVVINGGNGSVDYNGTVSHTANARAIEVTNKTGGTVDFDGAVTSNASSDGVFLSTNIGATTNFDGGLTINTSASNTTGFQATSSGTVNVTGASNSITSGTGAALDLNGVTAGAGGITFATVNTSGAANGVLINNLGQAAGSTGLDINGGAIANSTTRGVDITNASADVSVAATISTAASGRSVEVTNSGSTAAGGNTIVFSGAIDDNGLGILLDNNDQSNGATINFSGGLDIDTAGSNTGFSATNGGTVNVTGVSNSITTTTGIGLNVTNTTIGASDLNFHDISVNGAANGIILNATGSLGGLTVTGTGTTDGSGGTIQNTSGRGASFINANQINISNMNFTNAGTTDLDSNNAGLSTGDNLDTNAAIHLVTVTNVELDNINISGGAEQGINGNTVTNFALLNSTIDNAGNGADEDGVHFYNMLGSSRIVNTSITDSGDDNFNLQMQSGNLDLHISGGTVSGGVLGSGWLFGIRGTAIANLNLENITTQNNFSGGIVADAFDNSTMNIRVANSSSLNNNDQISLSANQAANVDAELTGNTVTATTPTLDFTGINLLGAAFGTGTFDARVSGNTITTASGVTADGMTVMQMGGGTLNVGMFSNIFNYAGTQRAVLVQGGQDGSGILRATIQSNTINMQNGGALANPAFLIQTAITGPGNTTHLDLNMGGAGALANTFTHPGGGTIAAGDIRVRQRNDGTFNLDGYIGGATDDTAVEAYLNGRNNEVSPSTATAETTGFTGTASPAFITVTVSATSVAEDGGTNLVYTFTRTGSTAAGLVANFAITGSAVAADFAVTGATTYTAGTGLGTVTFAAGSATTQITVDPTADGTAEHDESVVVDAGNSTTANGSFARALISNDDGAVFLSAGSGPKGDGTGGDFIPSSGPQPDLAPTGTPEPGQIVVDDGVLSQAELNLIVEAAIQRWAEAGASAEQIAAMRAVTFAVGNLPGYVIGMSGAGEITLDHNAAGFSWFIDATPGDDSEYSGDGTLLTAPSGTMAGDRMDLLTTIMHELGHQIGLGDVNAAGERDELMFGTIDPGERRLPGADDIDFAGGAPVTGAGLALTPINIGTIPAGRSVTIQWDSVVDPFGAGFVPTYNNASTLTGNNPGPFTVNSNTETLSSTSAPLALDSLVLGGTVWNDNGAGVGGVRGNGTKDGTEAGVDGVSVTLFIDNGSTAGVWDNTDTQLTTILTSGGGNYSFTGLAAGDYIIRIDQDNFTAGGNVSLLTLQNSPITTPEPIDPDTNIDNDDNGARAPGDAAYSNAITLAHNTETTPDGSGQLDINNTLDFGFFAADLEPTLTATAANPTYVEDAAAVDLYSTVDASTVEAGQTITSMTLTVTNVTDGANEILFFSGSDVALTHGNAVTTATNGLNVTVTVAANTATVTFSGAALTEAQLETLVDGLTYRNTSQVPTDANRVVTITQLVDSGSNVSPNDNTATLAVASTVNVDPANDTPVVTVASPLAVDEQVAEAIAPAGTISDVDLDLRNGGNGDYAGSSLTVARNGGSTAQDVLTIVSGAGFAVNGANLETSPGGLVFATFSGGNGAPLVISFTSSGAPATSALVDAVLQAVQYVYTGDNPPATIQLDVTLNDGAPANAGQGSTAGNPATGTGSITVNITDTPENQPPVVDLDATDAGSNDDTNLYVEQGAASGIGTDITVTDPESDNIVSATITITDPETGDLLSTTLPLPPGISVDGASTATTLILTGSASAAAYAAALGQVGYSSSSDDPTDGGTNPNRLITVVVNDAFGASVPRTMTMTVADVNDPPTLTATGTNPIFTEGDPGVDLFNTVTASTVEGGQTFTGMTLTVTNVTNGFDERLVFDGSDLQLMNGMGTTVTNSLSYTINVVGTTATVSFSGATLSAAQLQTLIDTMTYRHTHDNPTDQDRVITITQLVDSGSSVGDNENTATLSITSTVNVNPVNDPAVIVGDSDGSVTEAGGINNGSPGTPTDTGNLTYFDWDNNPNDVWQVVAPGAASIGGYGTYGVTVDGVWTYTLDNTDPAVEALNGAATLIDTFNAVTVDGTTQLVTITISAQNDTPTITGDASGDVTEAGGVANGTPGNVDDTGNIDSGDLDNTDDAWQAVLAGTASANGYGTYELTAAGVWTYTLDDSDAAVQALNGAATLTDTFDALTEDGTIQTVTITIHAQNDTAAITGDSAGDVTEAGGLNNGTPGDADDTGNLDSTDIDNTNDAWQAVAAGAATIGGYGTYAVTAAGVWTYTLDDNNAAVQALNGAATLIDTFNVVTADGTAQLVTITIHAQDDTPAANNDLFLTDEATPITGGDVFANNGSGLDGDPDGPGLFAVTEVNGNAGDVGTEITLDSGAKLTLNSDGTFDYDPDGVFDFTPTSGSGAINQPSVDTFTYTVTGGDTATVTINLAGLDTDDVLLSAAGASLLAGGVGNDTYIVDHTGDQVNEAVGEGIDAIYSHVSYTLGASSEVETLSTITWQATNAIDLTGNGISNYLIGNDGVNVLNGGGGADAMVGRAGNDVYIVDHAGDQVVEGVGGGIDAIYSAVSYSLNDANEVETLSTLDWTATTPIDLTGNALANYMIGNAGANVLDGKGGADFTQGREGNDVYIVDNALDIVFENAAEGSDAVYTKVSYALNDAYEVETLSTFDWAATTAINLTGNAGANYLIGNAGANVLDGKGGNDFLVSQGGADVFAFTSALGAGNVDTIFGFEGGDGDDVIRLDHHIFLGLANGTLDDGAFHNGTAAGDADDRIIYDGATGNLYFDSDGTGAAAQILFAVLDGSPLPLTAGDFIIV